MGKSSIFLLVTLVCTQVLMLAIVPNVIGASAELCGDTCWVGHESGTVGTTVTVPVTFKNCTELAGIVIPLMWDPDIVTLDSIDFTGSRVGDIPQKSDQKSTGKDIDNDANTVQLFALPTSEDMIAVGEGLFATLRFHIDAASDEPVVIDTTFIPPAGSYIFADPDANPVPTEFMPGSITVTSQCDCGAWGDVTGDGKVNPVDVVFIGNRIYMSNNMVVQHPNCPRDAGDANCDGNVNPVDMVLFVNRVYLSNNLFCPDPCGP